MKTNLKEFKVISNPHRKANNKQEIGGNINNFNIENKVKNEKDQNYLLLDTHRELADEDYDFSNTDDSDEYLKKEEKRFESREDKNEPPENKAKKLLEQGFINSFIDFFYIYQRKIPDISNSIRRNFSSETTSQKQSGDHSNNLSSLKVKLVLAERKYMRKKNYPVVINKYLDIRTQILQLGDSISSIYFNQKAIQLSSNRYQTDYLIKSLLLMGDCFQNPEDSDIRIFFKEIEAYEHTFQKYGFRNSKMNLEKYLYNSLDKLFQELALQQEQQNRYEEAIGHLQKQLIYLNKLFDISKNDYDNTKETEKKQIFIYLKVADLYFKQGNYNDAEECLSIAQKMINSISDDNNVSLLYLIYNIYYLES